MKAAKSIVTGLIPVTDKGWRCYRNRLNARKTRAHDTPKGLHIRIDSEASTRSLSRSCGVVETYGPIGSLPCSIIILDRSIVHRQVRLWIELQSIRWMLITTEVCLHRCQGWMVTVGVTVVEVIMVMVVGTVLTTWRVMFCSSADASIDLCSRPTVTRVELC
jgi:hypothetical protein